ncbi:hypothetical protein BDV96DRAFT_509591 [Lophiotrema nucula]|uniref:Gag1-like clamp domain-containing protein n=1 Tax=Lophiotrema nucula TaxID=690887 RepID=A0A6A5YEK2_9PLEO|nr:hypothetical protein BDV96DRAFT_509591 [Lophiotrema nucula]
MESNQSASRAARRFLAERVRTDWDWPNPPECWSASDEEVRGITQFRERYYGTTSEPESAADADADPYKFDSPDSIGIAVETRAESRKRQRTEALESEREWNEGLAQFLARRDAWTGVASVHKYGTRRPAKEQEKERENKKEKEKDKDKDKDNDALIPIAPRLLPGSSVRDSITPKAYHDIYEKVVITSRTPTVPINLSDMTRALVQGWKENGEWPPKSGPLDPLAGRKRAMLAGVRLDAEGPFLSHHPHVKKGVDSVRRIFHLNGHHDDGSHGQSAPGEKG